MKFLWQLQIILADHILIWYDGLLT